jgi:hypothetical protein
MLPYALMVKHKQILDTLPQKLFHFFEVFPLFPSPQPVLFMAQVFTYLKLKILLKFKQIAHY